MAYGLSNGHVTDNVTRPRKVNLVMPLRLKRYISKTAGLEIETRSVIQRTTNRK